jgi:uncharacterized membrane protein YfcA
MVVLAMVLNVGLSFAALVMAASFVGVDLGRWSQAAVKIAAIGTLAGAIGGVLSGLDMKLLNGPVLALHVVVLVYWIMIYMFFDLDVQETLLTVAIVTAFQIAAFCIVFGGG